MSLNGYRLPTEAECEYAARGGVNQKNFMYTGTNVLDGVGWYSINSNKSTQQVGLLSANSLGIFDLCGNVWEWCWDLFGEYTPVTDNPKGAVSGESRVRRGGSWMNNAEMCTVISRSSALPNKKFPINGLRVCKSL